MDKLKVFETFASVATRGSLSAAARAEGVAPAIIGRRLDALESYLGVKLLVRTTRRINLTHEGSAFLENCQRLLSDVANAEDSVSAGGLKASGHLRITAPAGFGRRHVAPLVPLFHAQNDSSLVSVRLADNRRLCVATPAYLALRGTPLQPSDLLRHNCLTLSSDASQTRGWAFQMPGPEGPSVTHLRPQGPLDCSDGQVLHSWCLAGFGIAWRSTWEVESDVQSGHLVAVLNDFAAPPNGIYGVFPQRKHLPLRLRLWIDFLKHHYALPSTWQSAT